MQARGVECVDRVGETDSVERSNGKGEYIIYPRESYDADIIQTHSHQVAESVLQTQEKILVLNIVRLPIEFLLSGFWENHVSVLKGRNFEDMTFQDLIFPWLIFQGLIFQGMVLPCIIFQAMILLSMT